MISTTTARMVYPGDGVSTGFPFSGVVLKTTDLVVIEVVIATGAETVLSLGGHYSIEGTPDSVGRYTNGVTVRAAVAPAATVQWVIYQDPGITQDVDLTDNGLLPVESQIELPLDRLTVIAQRTRNLITRSLRQPDADPSDIAALPSKSDRASKYAAFDANGDPIAVSSGVSDLTVVSGYMKTVLDDSTAQNARITLEIGSEPSRVRGVVGRRKTGSTGVFQISKIEEAILVQANSFGLVTKSSVYLKWPNYPTVMEVDSALAGPVVGGRDQADAFDNPANIFLYLIWNGTSAGLIASQSPHYNGPTLPSGYTHYAYLTTVTFTTVFADVQVVGSRVLLSAAALTGLTQTSMTFVDTSSLVPANALALLGSMQLAGTSTGGGALDALMVVAAASAGYAGIVGRLRLFQAGIVSTSQAAGDVTCIVPLTTTGFFYQIATTAGSSISGSFTILGYIVPNGDWG